jgi:hypothetical protein
VVLARGARHSSHRCFQLHGELEVLRVTLDLSGHLVFIREVVGCGGKSKSGQAVILGWCEKAQLIVAILPGLTEAAGALENGEAQAAPCQVIPGCQSGLPAADDDDIEVLYVKPPDP